MSHKLVKTLVLVLVSYLNVINGSKDKLIDDNINGMIAGFGDFDSDKFTDVFLITEKGKTLELLKAFPTEPVLRKWPQIRCNFNNTDDIIVGVIGSDFSGKAMMDVLVVTTNSGRKPEEHKFNIWLFKGNIHSIECSNISKPLVADALSHPFILDFNGDMIADFIVETEKCGRQLWTRSPSGALQPDNCQNLQSKDSNNNRLRFPHSNAFINLNDFNPDDNSPDIFISGNKYMEYWCDDKGFRGDPISFNYPNDGTQTEYKGAHMGQSAFIDINIDGRIDHILPICMSDIESCKNPQILGYDFHKKEWVTISDLNNGNNSFTFAEVNTFGQTIPITLRHGDIDGDGYIDLITIMKSSDKLKAVVLKNRASNNTFGRQFVIDWTSDKVLSPDTNVEIAAFIDLFEDGKLDILMTTVDHDKVRSVVPVVNTQMVAACFLKVLVTSGLCYGSSCPRGIIPYGTNQFGPYVCYQLQDLDGNWQTGCAGQLSQSGHTALQMPYSVFGLGETPNFVENVFASIPSGRMPSRHSKWTQIVPDAQVVLIPFPPNETTYWISKLFYTPSNIVFSTLITLAAICCFLVLIIGILHRKELLEDLAEHEEYKRNWIESR